MVVLLVGSGRSWLKDIYRLGGYFSNVRNFADVIVFPSDRRTIASDVKDSGGQPRDRDPRAGFAV